MVAALTRGLAARSRPLARAFISSIARRPAHPTRLPWPTTNTTSAFPPHPSPLVAPSPSRTMASAATGATTATGSTGYLTAQDAARIDEELMGPELGFALEQLMELAGLSVASAVRDAYPASSFKRVLVVAGPGNNGGDGLVAARHLHHFGYDVTVCYPKRTDKTVYQGLVKQLASLGVPLLSADELLSLARGASAAPAAAAAPSPPPPRSLRPLFDVAVDAVFGFSYSGGQPRQPFADVLALLSPVARPPPVVAVDIPSGWHVENGDEGGADALAPGVPGLRPDVLVSLTGPKLSARLFRGERHYVGGRFVPPSLATKYGLRLPPYRGSDQVALLQPVSGGGGGRGDAPAAAALAAATPTLLDPPAGPADTPPAAADMRISYTRGELLERDVSGAAFDPMSLFAEWFAAAAAEPGVVEPNAVCLATSDPMTGAPSARMVLLKNFTPSSSQVVAGDGDAPPPPPPGGSFVVYTNFESRKGRELFPPPPEAGAGGGASSPSRAANSPPPPRRAALTFYWEPLQRSVRVEGPVERVSDAEAEAYFASRPRGSQIGAWASRQSAACEGGREGLEAAERRAEARFAGSERVPKPPHWGGVRVRPLRVEFWQGRPSRLHDRLVFERPGVDAPWGGGGGGHGGGGSGGPTRLFP
jgi:pyridoxal 5'-phosphate synthase / NAD(P)H-hydrate epimerase